MIRIDVKPENIAEVEKALGSEWDVFDLDYENEETGHNEYWTRPYIEDGATNKISDKYPKINWGSLANEYDLFISINQIIDLKLDELEAKGLLTYFCTDINGIYWDASSYPVSKDRYEDVFSNQPLIDLYNRFEDGGNISDDVKKYLKNEHSKRKSNEG